MTARLSICVYIFFVISLFIIREVEVQAIAATLVLLVAMILLPLKKIKRGLVPISVFLLFTFGGNLFFHPGRIVYANTLLTITDEGLRLAGMRTLRVFSMLYGAKILTGLLSIDGMVDAFERMLMPLQRLGVPVKDFFSVTALTLKSFPVLIDYLGKTYREEIRNNGIRGFRRRIAHMVSFMMPVFVKSMRSPESFFGAGDKKDG